jgi:hypothetical protein
MLEGCGKLEANGWRREEKLEGMEDCWRLEVGSE